MNYCAMSPITTVAFLCPWEWISLLLALSKIELKKRQGKNSKWKNNVKDSIQYFQILERRFAKHSFHTFLQYQWCLSMVTDIVCPRGCVLRNLRRDIRREQSRWVLGGHSKWELFWLTVINTTNTRFIASKSTKNRKTLTTCTNYIVLKQLHTIYL